MNSTVILDYLTGKNVAQYYSIYKKSQWFNEDLIKALQLDKLKRLINHCYVNVPYYRKYMIGLGITPNDINSLSQINLFPIITKEIIQQNYTDFTPDNLTKIRGVKTTQTGGTTGNILFKRNDSNTRSSIWGSYKRYEDWMGYLNTDKTLILMGGHIINSQKERIISKSVNLLQNSYSVDIYDTSVRTIEKIVSLLCKNNFSHIRSYPQFLFSIAQVLEQRNLSFNIKSISTTAEPLMPQHRSLFKKVFNSETFDQFGCGEIGGIAYECDRHEGLHITDERVLIETNSNSELLVTDLDNYSMPFIRYFNADQAELADTSCSCGRQSKLIKNIMGRSCDYIIGLDGQFLHGAYFWHLIFDSKIAKTCNLRKFQVVQTSKTQLRIRLVADKLSDEEKDFFITNIKNRVGDMVIDFAYETDIENTTTGKYRPVINKLLDGKYNNININYKSINN